MDKKKLRYVILKEIDNGNTKLTEDDFDVSPEEFDQAVNFLTRENYLKGIFWADDRPQLFEGSAFLTEKGEIFLKENSVLFKSYKGLKEARDWLKL